VEPSERELKIRRRRVVAVAIDRRVDEESDRRGATRYRVWFACELVSGKRK
jgi:hypothetical protein